MVDFSNEVTVSTPAIDVMRIQILEARANLMSAIESYRGHKAEGRNMPTSTMQRRLWRLFEEIEQTLERHMEAEDFKKLSTFVRALEDKKAEDVIHNASVIFRVLDKVQLTRIDVKQSLGGNIVNRNKSQGWHS